MGFNRHSNTSKDTPNMVTAKIRSAENRRCENCGRKSALTTFSLPEKFGRRCRWCGWERAFDRQTQTWIEATRS